MNADPRPLHDRDPTGRFADRATDYARARPSYPPAAIDAILDGLGDPGAITAADIGAGTGISSRLLAGRGVRTTAVEPNGPMREAAQPHPLVTWADAAAEATGLPDNSFDLVLCAQSFHWFRAAEALREFHRILKPGGRLALVWNDDDPADAAMSAYRSAVVKAADRDWTAKNPFTPGALERTGLFTPARHTAFAHAQPLDLDGLIARALSASYVPRAGPRHEQLLADLHALHAVHAGADGLVRLGYLAHVYVAESRLDPQRSRPSDLNPTGRFSSRAEAYARFRPRHPPETLSLIIPPGVNPVALTIADIGAGTGLTTRLLASTGARLVAVEPNADMRGYGESLNLPNTTWLAATGEATGLQPASVDIVLCGNSFHWLRRLDALMEFHRILRPGGRLVLLWRDWWRADRFTRTLEDLHARVAPQSFQLLDFLRAAHLVESGLFTRAAERWFIDDVPTPLESILGLLESLSTTPPPGPVRDGLFDEVRSLHAAHADADGRATMRYRVLAYTADAVRFPSRE